MGLIARLIGTEEPRISVHSFKSGLQELALEKWTRAQFDSAFSIQAGAETTKMDAIIAQHVPSAEHYFFSGNPEAITLPTTADANSAVKALGFLRMECAGISKIEWLVRYNKLGTGTLTAEMRNETDSTTPDSFTDTGGAADNRENGGAAGTAARIITPGSPMAKGTKIFRLRIFNSTASQTLILYGWSVRLFRFSILLSETMHEVLMAAQTGSGPNVTEAQVEARLGI